MKFQRRIVKFVQKQKSKILVHMTKIKMDARNVMDANMVILNAIALNVEEPIYAHTK
jgi:hypothetical protein